MEAKELRIGLIVFGKAMGNVTTIMPLDIVASHQCEQAEKEIPFQPIPLTEEWLLKFGFDDIEDGWYTKGNEQFSWNIYDKCLRFRGMWIAEPDYVHQLQNIYYALTGEELKILTPV